MQYVWLFTLLGSVFTLGATRNSPLINTGDTIQGDKKEYGGLITAVFVVLAIGTTIYYYFKTKKTKSKI